MIFSLILAATVAATPIRLAGDLVRVGDVATAATGRDLSLLRLPDGRRSITLTPAAVRTLVANRLPGLAFTLRERADVRLVRGDRVDRRPAACLIARVAIDAGAAIDGAMTDHGRCAGPTARLGYDRALHLPRAHDDIAAGTNLGTLRVAAAAPLPVGQALTLLTRTGPVTIERQVVAVQPASPGARAFVRTQDGRIVSSRLAVVGRGRAMRTAIIPAVACAMACAIAAPARADQLYRGDRWAGVATDNRAQAVGDVVMVLISEAASATNRVRNTSNKETRLSGGLSVGGLREDGTLGLRGGYAGSGEVERTDRFVARMAAQVVAVLPNGDFAVEGRQNLFINGERRDIAIRGRLRQADISGDNAVASSRLAAAQIDYDGKGWVSRSAKPGLINRLFSFLGLG